MTDPVPTRRAFSQRPRAALSGSRVSFPGERAGIDCKANGARPLEARRAQRYDRPEAAR